MTDDEFIRLPEILPTPDDDIAKVDLTCSSQLTGPSFPLYVSANSRKLHSKCPRLWYERKVERLGEEDTNPDAHAGACFAAAMAAWRDAAYAHIGNELERARTVFDLTWGNYTPPEDHVKQRERVWSAFVAATIRWPSRGDWLVPIRPTRGTRAVEWPFAIPLPVLHPTTARPIYYVGIVDMAAHDRAGKVWVEDDKTSRSLGRAWEAQFRLNSAQIGYVWALQKYGLDVTGYAIRGVQIAKTKCDVQELTEPVPPYRVEAWYTRLVQDVNEMVSHYKMHNGMYTGMGEESKWTLDEAFPQRGMENGACGDYGGCPLIDLCSARFPQNVRSQITRVNDDVRGGIFAPLMDG